jgi:hypothetical protein
MEKFQFLIQLYCNNFGGIASIIDLVIIIAGINDVNVRNILNPTIDISSVVQATRSACYNEMSILLQQSAARFPNAKILVLGYYRMVSHDTAFGPLILLLSAIAAAIGSAGGPLGSLVGGILGAAAAIALRDEIARRCEIFLQESNRWFSDAVNETRLIAGNNGRIFFAYPAFADSNAIFASDPWIFGINANLTPQDEASASRSGACEFAGSIYPNDVNVTECKIASLGRPNRKGTLAYADIVTKFDTFNI